ncbi:MAG TPA: N-acetylmuramoyl-L-alanine amidase [Xanthobacteraceae bacterium]|nr:N-acetylmuramoyl-L-alanine amidase [Xanthobacteraceae bacterium]
MGYAMTGLLIRGQLVPVSGHDVIQPASAGGPAWAHLDPGDYRQRPALWVRQVLVHSTGGNWPMPLGPGTGPGGECRWIADIWQSDPVHSAAQIVVDSAGTICCLYDLAYTMAYHAEGSNPWSVGIEMYQFPDGRMMQATVDAAAACAMAICGAFQIPFQHHGGAYGGDPLPRMETGVGHMRHNSGGPDCVGIFGHRDNTSARGRGDPGDAIYKALVALGSESLDFRSGEDLKIARVRQMKLLSLGERLTVDGLVGPASMAAAKRQGFASWRDVA